MSDKVDCRIILNENITDEERKEMIDKIKDGMKQPMPLTIIPDMECVKLPNSVYVILDDLGEIENIFYDKKKAEKHCEFRNNIAPMSSYIVEKHSVYDADEDGEE